MTNFILSIAGTVISALLIGVGSLLWRQTKEVHKLSLTVDMLVKKVEKLERLVEGARKWRFDKTPLPEPNSE